MYQPEINDVSVADGSDNSVLHRTQSALREQIARCATLERELAKSLAGQGSAPRQNHDRLAQVIRSCPGAIVTLDSHALVLDWNPAAEELFGWKRDEVVGGPYPLVPLDDGGRFQESFQRMLKGEHFTAVEVNRRHKNGHDIKVALSTAPLYGDDNNIKGVVGVFLDMSEAQGLADDVSMLVQAVEQSPTLILIADERQVICYANASFCRASGYGLEELIGLPAAQLRSDKTPPETVEALERAIDAQTPFRGELVNRARNGKLFRVYCHAFPVCDEKGGTRYYIRLEEDITHLHALSNELYLKSYFDPLTSLYNRYSLDERLADLIALAAAEHHTHALLYVDIDQFEMICADIGIEAGESIIREIAGIMRRTCDSGDVAARISDDVFALLLRYCTPEEAEERAEGLRDAIHAVRRRVDHHVIEVTASIGLATVDRNSTNPANVLADARYACRLAKERGRNRFVTMREMEQELAARRKEYEWSIRVAQALFEDRLFLAWQPIKSTRDDSGPRRYEILVRLRERDSEVVMPGEFLPALERQGYVPKLDRWVITHTLEWLKSRGRAIDGIEYCAVNLSGISLGDPDMYQFISSELVRTQVSACKLCFEITETAAVGNLREARRFMFDIRELGCRFSIDDFGTGLASYEYLKILPVDYLKIDGSFVRELISDPVNIVLVKSMSDAGHALGKQIVGEFVEDTAILDTLREIGVDYAQGYAVGRPEVLE